MRALALAISLLCAAVPLAAQITTTPTSPEALAQFLAGAGITITNVTYVGAPTALGTYAGGFSESLGIDAGAVLSTGDIADIKGPNQSSGRTTVFGTDGDASLDALVDPFDTNDAAVLEFDFVTTSPNFSIRYIFASEEYTEYVGSPFNDVFAFFVDGNNIAVLPGSGEPVAINSVNHIQNTQFYFDNPPNQNSGTTQFDGFTRLLIAQTVVTPNVPHHIKIAIADTSDSQLDSAVFLEQGGISGAGAALIQVQPQEITLSNLEEADLIISGFGLPEDGVVTLSAEGLPEDSTLTFDHTELSYPDSTTATLRVRIGPETLSRNYIVNVKGVGPNGIETVGSVLVRVHCEAPDISGLAQPKSQAVRSGSVATLEVQALGTGPFRYQWYRGHPQSVHFPISGAIGPRFNTPPVTGEEFYWVRITNACGVFDSLPARVSVSPTKDTPKRSRPSRR